MVKPKWLQKPLTDLTLPQLRKVKYMYEELIRRSAEITVSSEQTKEQKERAETRKAGYEEKLAKVKEEIQQRTKKTKW